MVSYAVPSGQLPVKPRSPEHLNVIVKAESPTLNQGSTGPFIPPWQNLNSGMPGQASGLGRSSPHGHSSLSPKRELQQLRDRERERDVSYEEFSHERKRSKIQDSVHTISSQMQSQLLSPRGGSGSSGPALVRDAPLPAAAKYSEPLHSTGSICRIPPAPPLTPSVNPLDEPSPLGLTLRKTPSLLDLISMKLAQSAASDQGSSNPDALAVEAAKNRAGKCLVPTSTNQDKLKASNFPASSLKIGNWERVSRYEGDLVGKCYYAKRKLVWEVLESGLKSKIEIQWSDISAMKASCPENLPGTLDIEVSRPPLFFRETNPQPRKHTLWQATSDFTGGQATVNKRHYLVFPEGVLNRHYEKLVQCDPRLKALVEGTLQLRPNPDFERSNPVFDSQHQHLPAHQQSIHQNSAHDSPKNPQSYILPQHVQVRSNSGHSLQGLIPDGKPEIRLMKMHSGDLASPSSVIDARVSDESGTSDNEDLRLHEEHSEYSGPRNMERLEMMYPNERLEDVKPLCNPLYMGMGPTLPPDRPFQQRLEQLANDLLGEHNYQLSNDHQSQMILAQRVGNMSAALAEEVQLPHPNGHGMMDGSVLANGAQFSHFTPSFHVKSELGLGDDQLGLMMAPSDHQSHELSGRSHRDSTFNSVMSCISKHGSAAELLLHLPRVPSLSQFFENSGVPLGRYDPILMRPSYLGSETLR
ncbi:hypothetical protein R1flu_012435 [Riccia fluitans]|uniref:TRF2/HOY1 PH-like domain-containing protein n=1 Tax=Riccia fluitans TaxID=41844 RepID=A0ABD1ZAL0_9MARC